MKVNNSSSWKKSDDEAAKAPAKHKQDYSVSDSYSKGNGGSGRPASNAAAPSGSKSLSLADVNAGENKLPPGTLQLLSTIPGAPPTAPTPKTGELGTASIDPTPVAGSTWKDSGNLTLFPNGTPSAADVQQHGFGDCYCIATLSSLASSNPGFIQQAITQDPNDPNSYNVKMYDPSGAPITVAVNDSIAVDAEGNTVSTTGGDNQPNWASIAEKAYAKYTQAYPEAGRSANYNALSDGGVAASPMKAFTGQDATWSPTSSYGGTTDDATMAANMQKSINSGVPLVASTASGKSTTLASGETIVGSHAYTVSQVYQDSSGAYRVQVRNPWGTTPETSGSTGEYDDSGDGVIDMSMSEYQTAFKGTTTGGGNAATSGVNMNTRINAYGAEQIAQHKDPDNTAVYNGAGGQYTVVAGKDVYGNAQVQVFDGKGDKDEEFNFLGGTTLTPNSSYLVGDRYVNVDANGKPTISTTASNDNHQVWDPSDNSFHEGKSSPLNDINGGNGPH